MANFVQRGENDYKSRLDVIRNPETNHMSRTRTRTDRFVKKSEDTPTGKKKKKGFSGAYVAEVRRQVASGTVVAGSLVKHLHSFVIDMDLTSLYPSIMILLNLSPKTFVAKMIFQKSITIPMYPFIKFLDKEEKSEYKCNANDFCMESYVGKHWWAIMEIFCKMKSTEEIFDHIENHQSDFI